LEAIQQKEQDARRVHIQHRELILKIKDHILSAPNVHEHTLGKLCRNFGLSQTMLKREFKTLCGVSVSEFVRARVFDRTRFLLTTTKKTIEEIAVEVGYSSREALERSFKREFIYTPSHLRTDQNS
jgi:AraC-like DNA-binding protein